MSLTQGDLKNIKTIVKTIVDDSIDDAKEELKNDMADWRSEFYTKIDPILKEVSTSREERLLLENRVEKLEKVVFDN